jgi:hypothetical protein
MFGKLQRDLLYGGYIGLIVLTTILLVIPATPVSGCCHQDCNWSAPGCTDPCDYLLQTDEIVDGSCQYFCCNYGICFIKERNEPTGPCQWICTNNDYGQCTGNTNCLQQ